MSQPGKSLQPPSLPWRVTSSTVIGVTALLSKWFIYGLNRVEVTGLPGFLEILDKRRDPEKRDRGLITVSNHISVLDDPLIWGVLPLNYLFDAPNTRWSLGAYDILFKNKLYNTFFTYGQVLPTHRAKHSPHGGLFQPTVTQAVRLLSSSPSSLQGNLKLTYSTTGRDAYPSPAAYAGRRHAWVHVFPEGCVHQHATSDARYFKWGAARLVLESDPAPDVVPLFVDGTQHVMPEDRRWPRFVPRVGATIRVAFGKVVDGDAAFGDLRRRWRALVEKERQSVVDKGSGGGEVVGEELTEELKCGEEARAIRVEAARRLREEVLKVRATLGYPPSDPSFALAETWAVDPDDKKKYKSRVDGSEINQN